MINFLGNLEKISEKQKKGLSPNPLIEIEPSKKILEDLLKVKEIKEKRENY